MLSQDIPGTGMQHDHLNASDNERILHQEVMPFAS